MKIFLILIATFLTIGPVHAASNQRPAGMGFQCDVNTKRCTCSGIWDGADCEAMKKNCKDKINPAGCNASEGWCICVMALKRPVPKNVVPLEGG